MTEYTNASEALRYATEANDLNAWADEQRVILATTGQTFAQLAVADAIDRQTAQLRTYLDSVNPPTHQNQPVGLEEQITDADLDAAIEDLATRLWAGDPGNQANPARRFQDDYTHRQDQYRAMARVALGLNDEPQDKNGRRP